jgi:hypothetical protein
VGTSDSPDKEEDALVPLSKPWTEARIQKDQSSDYAEKNLRISWESMHDAYTYEAKKSAQTLRLYEGRIAFLPKLFSKSAVKTQFSLT